MKKFLLLTGLLLGGCSAAQQQTETQIIAAVQQQAVLACSFLPTASTVAGILAAGNPALTAASAVAQAICAAVSVTSARVGTASPPVVAGVVIHGKFTK